MNRTYKLVNHKPNNKIISGFKNSFLGADIGVKNENFANVIVLSTIIAIGTICLMYYFWRV